MRKYVGFTDQEPRVFLLDDASGSTRLNPRRDLKNFAQGFGWGPQANGDASQLALALIADAVGDEPAVRHCQDFARHVIRRMTPGMGWNLTGRGIRDAVDDFMRDEVLDEAVFARLKMSGHLRVSEARAA